MSASDRMAVDSTHPTAAYFGGAASGRRAMLKLAEKDRSALNDARQFVKTDPVDPAASSTLGTIRLALNRPEQAYDAFRVAGNLGWRDIPTQLYWLSAARAMGDVEIAAERMDALLRMDADDEVVEDTLTSLADTPLGQAALTNLLKKDPPWGGYFLSSTGNLPRDRLDVRLTILEKATRSGAHLDCESVASAVRKLISRKYYKQAEEVWQVTCGNRTDDLIFNGNFEAMQDFESSSPFAWHLYSKGGLDVSLRPAPPPLKGRAAYADSSLTARTRILSQTTILSPGDYRVSWRTAGGGGKLDPNMSVMVRCNDAQRFLDLAPVSSSTNDANSSSASFAVPPSGCPLQTLIITMAAAQPGQSEAGWIDDISLKRLSEKPS